MCMSFLIYRDRNNGMICMDLTPQETKKCLELIGRRLPTPFRLRQTSKNIFAELDKELKQKTINRKLKKVKKK